MKGQLEGVGAYAIYRDELYAGVYWCRTAPGHRIYRLSSDVWKSVGEIIDGSVTSLVVFKEELYVAGSFHSIGGMPALNIASWNGTRWRNTVSSLPDKVVRLAVHSGQLYAATQTMSDNKLLNRIFVWNGDLWTQIGESFYGDLNFLISHGSRLCAGGRLSLGGENYGLAVFEEGRWNPNATSENATLTAAAVYGDEIYFTSSHPLVSLTRSFKLWTVMTVKSESTGWSIPPSLTALATGSMWNWREDPP
jgi:hypothetical protein